MNLKRRNPNLKVLVAIGGYNPDLITAWYRMAENRESRNNFARNILNLIRSQNLDGIGELLMSFVIENF